jgi:predicted nucleic-acid-binding protein
VSRHRKYPDDEIERAAAHAIGKVTLQRRVAFQVLIPEALALELVRFAKRFDRTVAEIIVEAVRDLLGAVEGNG